MWTRSELKEKAKIAFKRNYWKCVLAALIVTFLTGTGSSTAGTSVSEFVSGTAYEDEYDYYDDYEAEYYEDEYYDEYYEDEYYDEGALLEEILNVKVVMPSSGLKYDLLRMAGENAIKAMEDQNIIKVIHEDKYNAVGFYNYFSNL